MLLEFSVANFRSFFPKRTFTMQASKGIGDFPDNISNVDGHQTLRTAVVYGANSSGKTNLVRAFDVMRHMVIGSAKLNAGDKLQHDPFLLMQNAENSQTYFEVLFVDARIRYRYGFEYDKKQIVGEWLFFKDGKKREKLLFLRNNEGIAISELDFKEGAGLEEKTNDNRLFLSVVAQLGGIISKHIVEWFSSNCLMISGIHHVEWLSEFSKKLFHEKLEGYDQALDLLQKLKFGFDNLSTAEYEFDPSSVPNNISDAFRKELIRLQSGSKSISLLSIHKKHNKQGAVVGEIPFDVYDRESDGTQKFISLLGPIVDTLLAGRILIIDELDCRMHPIISDYIVRLFNNKETNPNNAQLIFTTHDTNLLSSKIFRRDQIWFTEKDETEQTDLYTLNDIVLPNGKKPRSDSNYEKNYIAGRYGAVPFIE